jgi:plasmid segregation protein ParM
MSNRTPSLLTVGLDIGYGVTKALLPGQAPVIFPSVCGYAREIKFKQEDLAQRYPGEQITDERGDWFVGDLALGQLPPGELRKLRGRTGERDEFGLEFRVRMARVALGKLLGKQAERDDALHIRLATGLPVEHMRVAAELKQALLGQHPIQTDAARFVANVVEVRVMPQPYGTLYQAMLTAQGEVNTCHTARRTGVVDVGTYTIDLALDDDGIYIDTQSGSTEGGVFTAQERIADLLRARYYDEPSYRAIEQVLRTGCYRAFGKEVDFRAEVDEALDPLRAATLNLMADKWKVASDVDVIYLAGGGAPLVERQVKATYAQTSLAPDAQLANVRGFLSYALFRAQNGH